jgi:DNA-directed RNA polymerase subunit K
MLEKLEEQFTKYEIARILGARALQISMDAPLLLKIDEKELEAINYNPFEIAKRELVEGVLPITVNRPLPKKKEEKIRKLSKEEIEEIKRKEKEVAEELGKAEELAEEKGKKKSKGEPVKEGEAKLDDKKIEDKEEGEEKEIAVEGEIMELAAPEDESEDSSGSESGEEGI